VTLQSRLGVTNPANLCTICTPLKSTDPDYLFAVDSMVIFIRFFSGKKLMQLLIKPSIGTAVPVFYSLQYITIYWSKVCVFRNFYPPQSRLLLLQGVLLGRRVWK